MDAPPQTIQSVDRAATLLRAVAGSQRPLSVAELAEACGLHRTTAWRLLATLDRNGLVDRDPVSQRYAVGYALVRMATSSLDDTVIRRARPALERLAAVVGETVSLALPVRLDVLYVDQIDPPQIMSPNWLGKPIPLHATSTGKAFLACIGRDERDTALGTQLQRYTDNTITVRSALERELESVRRDGYSVCAGELEESLYGASAAALDVDGRPLAIVSVWGPEHRVPRKRLTDVGKSARAAAREIEEALR